MYPRFFADIWWLFSCSFYAFNDPHPIFNSQAQKYKNIKLFQIIPMNPIILPQARLSGFNWLFLIVPLIFILIIHSFSFIPNQSNDVRNRSRRLAGPAKARFELATAQVQQAQPAMAAPLRRQVKATANAIVVPQLHPNRKCTAANYAACYGAAYAAVQWRSHSDWALALLLRRSWLGLWEPGLLTKPPLKLI